MSNATIHDSLTAFFENPTEHRFRRLQRRVMASADYDPLGVQSSDLPQLCEESCFEELLCQMQHSPANWRLGPRFHFLAGIAASELGDFELAHDCRESMQACLRGLLSTGEGTKRRPFRVTFLTDEYDLMRVLGGDVRNQQLVNAGSKRCDVITCHDGSEVWFEVTGLLAKMQQSQRQEPLWPVLSTEY